MSAQQTSHPKFSCLESVLLLSFIARAVTALLSHARSRLMVLPWKYRARFLAAVRRRIFGVDKLGTRRLGVGTAGH